MWRLVAGWICVVVVGTQLKGQEEGERVRLDRAGCPLGCAVYSVEISPSGSVTFTGRERVAERSGTKQVGAAAYRAVISEFERAGFFDLNASYKPGQPECSRYASDGSTATLSIVDGSRSKIVSFYYGCLGDGAIADSVARDRIFHPVGAPGVLKKLATIVDSVAGANQWAAPSPGAKSIHPTMPRTH